jgi:D-amino-acid oxidase
MEVMSVDDPLPDICVVGGGVSGLTTAIVLRLLGYRVRLVAERIIATPSGGVERQDPTFASLYPAASIIPHTVAVADAAWHLTIALRFYAALQYAATAGVRRQRHFELFERPMEAPDYAARLEGFELVSESSRQERVSRRPGCDGVWGWTFESYFAEMPTYGQWLRRTFSDLGGQTSPGQRLSPSDLATIPEPIVVNCTGYGSASLFGAAAELILVKGLLVRVDADNVALLATAARPFSYNYTPDAAIYATQSGAPADVYWYPRVDGWILGGTRLAGQIDASGDWTGETPVGPTIAIDGLAVPRPIVELNRDLIMSVTGIDIGAWRKTAAVGYRCVRSEACGGVRLEAEALGNKLLMHNYGHGGAGVTLAWSSAIRVGQLLATDHDPGRSGHRGDGTTVTLLAELVESAMAPE